MITGIAMNGKGFSYTWHGKFVAKEGIKPMSPDMRTYMCALSDLIEQGQRGLFMCKLATCRKYYDKKGSKYVSVLHHLENMELW